VNTLGPIRPLWVETVEREQVLDALKSMLDSLQPGQAVKVVSHDPDAEADRRHFTVTMLGLR
jgi:hypothetical protein